MRNFVVLFFILGFFFSCKKEPSSTIGSQDQSGLYRPFLDKEQDFKNKNGEVSRRVEFLDNGLKKMTDFYEGGEKIRLVKYFKNDLQDGRTVAYYPSGKIQEVQHYANGKQMDRDTIFYETGEIHFVYNFENDKKNGWMYRYDKAGHQEFAALYKDDLVAQVIDSLNLSDKK